MRLFHSEIFCLYAWFQRVFVAAEFAGFAEELCDRDNARKRYLPHVAGHEIGLLVRLPIGARTPKEAAARGRGLISLALSPDDSIPLMPGDYTVYIGIRDSASSKLGTRIASLQVPTLSR